MKNIIFAILFCGLPVHGDGLETLHVHLGGDLTLPLTSPSIWIEDSKVLKGQSLGARLRLSAIREGSSLVTIGNKKYQVYVIRPQAEAALLKLKPAVKKVLGLQVELSQGLTQLRGTLYRLADWKKIAKELSGSEVDYQMSAKISRRLENEAQIYFDDLFERNGLNKQKINFFEGVQIRLPARHPQQSAYRKILYPYGIAMIEDSSALLMEPTVRVQITVAEVQRQFTQKIGLRWPDAYQAQIIPDAMWNFESVEGVAHFFEQSGNGRVLASPNILCRSGKEAEFMAGGEFPIKIVNHKMHDVIWKKYGVFLKVRPLADGRGQMSLQIDTEVSSLDNARSVDGLPGIIMHKVSSYFDLRQPQTIALSGLIKNEESRSSDGLPWLSRLPILGTLFSSKDFKENRTELVIFVRPQVLPEAGAPQIANQHLKDLTHETKK